MTFAPAALLELRDFLKGEDPDLDNNEVGIVGGPSHIATGTSYHLGKDQLKMAKNPYSARTARDKAGLADPAICNAASAIDIDDDLDDLRPLSVWLVDQCRAGAPDTLDIREIIYSPDGVIVLQWDRERGQHSAPQPHADLSHRQHTHVGFYRDSVRRSKVGVFRRFYATTRKVIDMFFLKVASGDAIYISDGLNTRLLPGGQWPLTGEPLVKAGVPLLTYPSLPALLDGGGPLVKDASPGSGISEDELRTVMREEIAKTRLV